MMFLSDHLAEDDRGRGVCPDCFVADQKNVSIVSGAMLHGDVTGWREMRPFVSEPG
jgi:hypothetical protein